MNKKVAIILVNYQDYAEKYLDDCLASLRAQDYQGEMKIFLVNNEVSSESLQRIMKKIPEAEIIINKSNDGFAKGNNDGIKQALLQNFDYVFCVNLDVVIEPDCVKKMVEVVEEDVDSRLPAQAGLLGNDKNNELCLEADFLA